MSKTDILSIVIPAYNEEKTVISVLKQLENLKLPQNYKKEIIIINDCSKDSTRELIEEYIKDKENILFLNNEINLGKTQTVKRGLQKTSGDFVIIQDSDSEYRVEDINNILNFALENNLDVVYGDRFAGDNGMLYKSFYIGNKGVTFFSNLFTYPRIKKVIPDMEVCYKLVHGDVMRAIAPTIRATSSFGLEPEITARLARYKLNGRHLKFGIVPIKYYPRTIEQGKKIRYTDGIKAVAEIIKYNLFK